MNDTDFTRCAILIADKAAELTGIEEYRECPDAIQVSRRATGYVASLEDLDCPSVGEPLLYTRLVASESAALTRLAILLQEELDKKAEREEDLILGLASAVRDAHHAV